MFGKSFQNIKSLVKVDSNDDNKRKTENLVLFLILLIVTVVAINIILKSSSAQNREDNENSQNVQYKQLADNIENASNNFEIPEYNLEKDLEDTLSKISGVGQVKALITYSKTSEIVPMYNETNTKSITNENDTNGGVRTIEQSDLSKEVIYEESSGKKFPVTQQINYPKIEGAVIIAEGAGNTNIKIGITQAVEALTGLPTHKIQVFEMKG